MNLFKKNIIRFFGLVFVFLFSFGFTFAVDQKDEASNQERMVNISIENAKIISQENNVFKIGFDLVNGKNMQVGVRYGVRLSNNDKNGKFVLIDEKIFDEDLTLLENSRIYKEIEYKTNPTFNGKYNLTVISSYASSFPFALYRLGEIDLNSSVEGVFVDTSTCFLSVEKDDKKYKMIDFVDISKDEKLILNCEVFNNSKKDLSVNTLFKTYLNKSSTDTVNSSGGYDKSISLKANQKTSLNISLPKAEKAGSYHIKFSLNNSEISSNEVDIFYSISGISANITNIFLDKDYYKKGENINLSLEWLQSFNNYKRLKSSNTSFDVKAKISILNKEGKECIAPHEEILIPDYIDFKNEFSLFTKRNCINPVVNVVLLDKDNNIFDQKEFKVITQNKVNIFDIKKISGISVILIFIILIVFFFLKNKNINKVNLLVLLFFFLFSSSVIALSSEVLTVTPSNPMHGDNVAINWSMWIPNPPQGSNACTYDVEYNNGVAPFLSNIPLSYSTLETNGPNQTKIGGNFSVTAKAPTSITLNNVKIKCNYTSYQTGFPEPFTAEKTITFSVYPISATVTGGFTNNPYSCNIISGANSCNANVSWSSSVNSTPYFINELSLPTIIIGNFYTSGNYSISNPYGVRNLYLTTNINSNSIISNIIDTTTMTSNCSSGLQWFGNSCDVPITINFSGTNTIVDYGSSTSLSWNSTGPAGRVCTRDGQTVNHSGNEPTGSLTSPTTYNLSCSYGDQTSVSNITIYPRPQITITASPASVVSGGSTQFTVQANNIFGKNSCKYAYSNGPLTFYAANWVTNFSPEGTTRSKNIVLTLNQANISNNYLTVNCKNEGAFLYSDPGTIVSNYVTIVPPVNITTQTSPNPVNQGGNVLVTWSATGNPNMCAITSPQFPNLSGNLFNNQISGSYEFANVQNDFSYTINCNNTTTGQADSETVNVSVVPVNLPVVAVNSSPNQVPNGGNSQITWSATNANYCSVANSNDFLEIDIASGQLGVTGSLNSKILNGTPGQQFIFTINCYGDNNQNVSGSTTVTIKPPTGTLSVSNPLCYIAQNESSCSTEISYSVFGPIFNNIHFVKINNNPVNETYNQFAGLFSYLVNGVNDINFKLYGSESIAPLQEINENAVCAPGTSWISGSCQGASPIPVNGSCTDGLSPVCSSGNLSVINGFVGQDGVVLWKWYCKGISGGSDSGLCYSPGYSTDPNNPDNQSNNNNNNNGQNQLSQCNDKIDNDGDGKIDLNGHSDGTTIFEPDLGCSSLYDTTENNVFIWKEA